MKTILCPVDFSATSEDAVKYALEINKKLNGKIILLHVFSTPVYYSDIGVASIPYDNKSYFDSAVKKLTAYSKKITSKDGFEKLKIELIVQQGLASSIICDIASEKKVDMIVMGTTGTNAAERLLIGSNTSRVIKNAPCMLMVIPSKAKFTGMDKIIYATDLSNSNLDHVKSLIPFAKIFNTEILFLYIDKSFAVHDDSDMKRVTEIIRKSVPYSKKSGYVCTDLSVSDGISYFLKHHSANCLAMFTQHRSLLKELYQTSVTKKIALHATVPLIVLHENDFAASNRN